MILKVVPSGRLKREDTSWTPQMEWRATYQDHLCVQDRSKWGSAESAAQPARIPLKAITSTFRH